MITFLENIDSSLFLFFNSWHTDFLDRLMVLVTGRFIWIPMYAMIILILLRNFKLKNAIIYAVGIILAVTIADQLCATIIRPVFHRLRPSNPENPLSQFAILVNGYRGGNYGFPSCHAANSFALASFLCMLIKRGRFRIFIVSWATINAYSRLYLGVHYPGDLLVGGIIGIVAGVSLYLICNQLMDKLANGRQLRPNPQIPIPLSYYIAGNNYYVSPVDVMIGTGSIILMTIIFISII